MQTFPAERTEILRGERKDEEYITELNQRISNVFKDVAGDSAWIRAYKWLLPVTKLTYYGNTTLAGRLTLGEEYMGIVPVQSQVEVKETTFIQRLLFVLMEAFGAELVDQKLEQLRQLDELYYQQLNANKRPPLARVLLSTLLKSFNFATFQRLHWAVFYLMGSRFYSIWKRVCNIQFVSLRPETNIRDGTFFCDICLNAGEPVSTPCGHVYCFDCILFHSENAGLEANKGQCPSCRFQFELRHVIPLMNL